MAENQRTGVHMKVHTVRTKDGKGREPADVDRIIDIPRKADYRGYVVLEYEGKAEPKTEIPKWIAKLRQAAS